MMKSIVLIPLLTFATIAPVAIAIPASPTLMSQQPRTNQISGKIIRIDDDDFILSSDNQQIEVDGESRPIQQANLKVGEQVTVIGDWDDEEFDARIIIRSDGSKITVRD